MLSLHVSRDISIHCIQDCMLERELAKLPRIPINQLFEILTKGMIRKLKGMIHDDDSLGTGFSDVSDKKL